MQIDLVLEKLLAHKWVKPSLIGIVILISGALGAGLSLIGEPVVLIVVLVLLIGMAGVTFLIQHPQFGILLILISAMVVPFGVGTGTQTSINAAMLMLMLMTGLWFVRVFIGREQVVLVRSATVLPIVLLVASAFISLLMGQLDWFPTQHAPLRAQLGGLALFFMAALGFLIVAQEIKQVRWLEILTWTFLVLGGMFLVTLLVPPIGNLVRVFFDARAYGSVFWLWFMAFSFSQAAFNTQLKLRWRIGLGLLLAMGMYVALGPHITWTSGWAPAVAALLTIMIVSRSRLAIAVLVAGAFVAVLNLERVYEMVMSGDNVYSLDTRLAAWQILVEIFRANFLFGLGPSNYYYYTPLFRIMGYYVPFNSHNNIVDIIAQTGILGLFFFLMFAWRTGLVGLKLLKSVPEGFPKAYVYGAIGGVIGTLVSAMLGDWVIPFVYNIGFFGFRAALIGWMFLGGLVALEQIYQKDA